MKLIYKYLINILLAPTLLVLIYSCGNSAENSKSENTTEPHEEVDPNQVTLTEDQFNTVGIKLGTFENKNLKNTIKANGVLDLPPQNKASISVLSGGVISKINVIQGDFVQKGQTLALLENQEIIKLQQDYLEAKSNYIYAEKEYERQKLLFEEKIVAGKKFQQAEADYTSQQALITSLENQLKQLGISPQKISNGNMVRSINIKAPIHGFVHKIEVNTGSYVEPSKEIFAIVDNHHVHIDLQVYESDIPKVKVGQTVLFSVASNPSVQYEAKIFAVGKAFESETKSVPVHAEIEDNKNKNLLPGLYVNGRIQLNSNQPVLTLPNDAIASEGELKYIFIKGEADHKEDEHSKEETPGKDEGNEKGHNHKEEGNTAHNHEEKAEHEHKGEEHEHKEGEEEHGHEEGIMFTRIEVRTGVSDMGYTEIIPLKEIPKDAQIVTKGAYYLAAQMRKSAGGGEEGHGH